MRAKGQITLPEDVRKAARLEEGDLLDAEITSEGILLRRQRLIDATQAWFWTPEWQEGEREVDADLAAGRVERFESDEAFLKALRDAPSPWTSRPCRRHLIAQFASEFDALTPMQQTAFLAAVSEFVEDSARPEGLPRRFAGQGRKGRRGYLRDDLGGRRKSHLRVRRAGPGGRGSHRLASHRDARNPHRTMTQLLPSHCLAGVRDPCSREAEVKSGH